MANKGFFGRVFDFSFTDFVTIRVIKVIFILAIIGSAIGGIAVLVGGIRMLRFQPLMGVIMILLSPVAFLLYVLLARIWLELIVVIFRIEENTSRLVEQGKA